MPNIITVNYINQIQFLQMPKAFLYNPKYELMSNESKIIYTLLRDLTSLSIKSKWINENNEVYVKFSREKLAKKVNVSPTNKKKMSALMKELKDLDLIVEKSVGLNKCNEIYVCIPEDLAVAYDPEELLGESELAEKSSPVTIDTQGGGKNGTSGGGKNGTSRSSKLSPHINTNTNKTNINNKSSSSVPSEDEEDLTDVINLFKECINRNITSKQKDILKELVATYGKEKVLAAINVTVETATNPGLKYLRKVCFNGINVSVSAPRSKSNNSKFTNTYKHNFDMDELERLEREHLENKLYRDNNEGTSPKTWESVL